MYWFLIRLRCDTEDFNVSPTGFRKPRKFESEIRVNFACGILNSGLWKPEYFDLILIIILPFKLDTCINLKKDEAREPKKGEKGYEKDQLLKYITLLIKKYWHRQFKVDRLQIVVVAKKYIYVSQLFISRMLKMRAIPQFVSAPLNPIPIRQFN